MHSLFKNRYRDRDAPHKAPLPHHAAYGSVLRDSADQAESDPGGRKTQVIDTTCFPSNSLLTPLTLLST
jgi:hypothetical protein